MKNVPGRRTDWHECQWLQFLHSVGLLRASFRPEENICAVRTVLRHRSELVMAASQHVQHMHKALTQMNLQIHHVISDITATTGLAIVDAILAGQRDAAELAKLRDPHIKAHEETIRKSLVGNWRSEHLFTLKQSRELYRTYQQLIVGCDLEIEKMLPTFEARTDPVDKPLPPDRKRNEQDLRAQGRARVEEETAEKKPVRTRSVVKLSREFSQSLAFGKNRNMGCQDGTRSVRLKSIYCSQDWFWGFPSIRKPNKYVPASLSDGSRMEFLRTTTAIGHSLRSGSLFVYFQHIIPGTDTWPEGDASKCFSSKVTSYQVLSCSVQMNVNFHRQSRLHFGG